MFKDRKEARMFRRMAATHACLLAVLSLPVFGTAAEYFVDKNHPSASDSNPGTEASPWATIGKANTTLTAGSTVWIKAGIYSGGIAPANSGTAANPITYSRYQNQSVVVSNVSTAVDLLNDNYIRVNGINFTRCDSMLWIDSGENNVIQNCSFGPMRSYSDWEASRIHNGAKFNVISNCVFFRYGNFSGNDNGALVEVGNEENSSDQTSFNLFINCEMYSGGHHVIGFHGFNNILMGCYLHNEVWDSGYGNRVVYSAGFAANSFRNLIDGNRIAWSADPPDNEGSSGFLLTTKRYIVRRNSFYKNSMPGLSLSCTAVYYQSPEYNYIYQNTFYRNGVEAAIHGSGEKDAGVTLANYGSSFTLRSNVFKNNLFWQNPKSVGTYGASINEQVWAGNMLQTADPRFVNITSPQTPSNPLLPDLHLLTGSPAIDTGVPLTTISSATGTGTSFTVNDPAYFMDGWGLIPGDRVQIAGTSQTASILSVNYSTRVISFDRQLSWSQGQGLALAYEGSAPDVGAHEFRPVNAPPAITSALAASGQQGRPFSYVITADNSPQTFGASGLPSGLTVATGTGAITGTPQVTGTFPITITAANSFGTDSETLTLTITPPAPIIGVAPGQLVFPEIGTGQSAQLDFLVTNSGAGLLNGSANVGSPFRVVTGGSYSLNPGDVWRVTIGYSPLTGTSHQGNVIFTGGGGSTNQVSGTAFPVLGWSFAAVNGIITSPFTSSGGFVSQNVMTTGNPVTSGAGRAVYGFTITNAGNYLVSAMVDAPDTGADSLYVNVDAEPTDPTMIWDIPVTVGVERRTVAWRGAGSPTAPDFSPKVFALSAGVHRLIIRGREPGVRLQTIEITRDASGGPAIPADFRIISFQ